MNPSFPIRAEIAPRVLWSIDLPSQDAGYLTLTENGSVIASSTNSTTSLTQGRLSWNVNTAGPSYEEPAVTTDGRVYRIEGEYVIGREPESGNIVNQFPAPMASGLTVAPWGDLMYSSAQLRDSAILQCVSLEGEARWTKSLNSKSPLAATPQPLRGGVVAYYDGALRALSQDGTESWRVDREGFYASLENIPTTLHDNLWMHPRKLSENAILVGLEWDSGRSLYVVEIENSRIYPYVPTDPANAPLAVFSGSGDDFCVAAQGPPLQALEMQWEWGIQLLDRRAETVWKKQLRSELSRIIAGKNGLVVSGTPSKERWLKYSGWGDVTSIPYVKYLNLDGSERWHWGCPGAITHFPVIDLEENVYFAFQGRLHALAAN